MYDNGSPTDCGSVCAGSIPALGTLFLSTAYKLNLKLSKRFFVGLETTYEGEKGLNGHPFTFINFFK